LRPKEKETGEINLDNNFVLGYSCIEKKTRAKESVGIIISEELKRNVTKWIVRIIRINMELQDERITLIQIHDADENKNVLL
jgi:hypothetical protein